MKHNPVGSIQFFYQAPAFHFPERTRLKCFLIHLFEAEKKKVELINYVFCTDAYLLNLNITHLNHNTYTDIITFELSGPKEPLVAEVYISVERVRENASGFQKTFLDELRRVIFHGALHLCGFMDKHSRDIRLMREKEDEYLHKYHVSRGTKKPKF